MRNMYWYPLNRVSEMTCRGFARPGLLAVKPWSVKINIQKQKL